MQSTKGQEERTYFQIERNAGFVAKETRVHPSATKIKSNLNLEKESIRTIQRVLKNFGHLLFNKRKVGPHLKANQVTGRLKWAEDRDWHREFPFPIFPEFPMLNFLPESREI